MSVSYAASAYVPVLVGRVVSMTACGATTAPVRFVAAMAIDVVAPVLAVTLHKMSRVVGARSSFPQGVQQANTYRKRNMMGER